MAQDYEFDQLKDERDQAFQRKQDTWKAQDDAWRVRKPLQDALDQARDRQQELYEVQQRAWERRRSAEEDTSRARETKQDAYDDQQAAWEELNRLRDRNGPRIGALREEHDDMFERIQSLSSDIDSAFASGDREHAFEMIEEVKQLRSDIHDLPPQWRELSDEIREAKEAHARASEYFKPLQAEFVQLRSISDAAIAEHKAVSADFQAAKAAKREAQAEFDAAKAEHERRTDEFRAAKAEHERAKDAFNRRLSELRAEQERHKADKRSLAQQAGVPSQYLDDVWVSIDADGNVNIYFGGVGEPVGDGHGHYAMDPSGQVTYRRGVGEAHGAQNFTGYEEKSRQRPGQAYGWSNIGPNEGLIAGTKRDPSGDGTGQWWSETSGGKEGGQDQSKRHPDGSVTYWHHERTDGHEWVTEIHYDKDGNEVNRNRRQKY